MKNRGRKQPYSIRGRPEKNPKRLRIERLKAKGLYPSDEARKAQSEASRANGVPRS